MAKTPAPAPKQTPMVQGPIERVPCPHCGKANDFRKVDEMLDVGNIFSCDHCKQKVQICGVRSIRIVALRKPGNVVMQRRG